MKVKKYKRITATRLHTFSNKCAKVVKAIVEIELGPISIPSLEYLLARSIEEWIQECDAEKETIWNMVYKIPATPVLEDPKKKKKKKKSLGLNLKSLGRTPSKKKVSKKKAGVLSPKSCGGIPLSKNASKKKNPLISVKKIKTAKKCLSKKLDGM